MKIQNYMFEDMDTLLRLSEAEEILRKSGIVKSLWCRKTLIEMCEDGTFENQKIRGQYFVYESSVLSFIERLQKPKLKAA